MTYRNLLLSILVLLALGAPLVAQDDDVFDVMMALGSHPAFEMGDDGGFLVAASGDRRRVLGVDQDARTARLETVKGPLIVSLPMLSSMDKADLDELTALIDRAPAFPKDEEIRYGRSALLGPNLAGGGRLVTADGVLAAGEPRDPPTASLADSVAAVLKDLKTAVADEAARRAIAGVLGGLEADPESPLDGAEPRLLRRLVGDGWLDAHLGASAHADALAAAVRDASSFVATRTYSGEVDGEPATVERFENAVGRSVDVLKTSAAVRYAVNPPQPFYVPRPPELALVVECPPDTDPLADRPKWTRASLHHDGIVIASCDPEGGFSADEGAWRKAFRVPRDPQVNPDMMPPHVPVVSALGEMISLVTPHGRLDPVRLDAPHGVEAEAERFLSQAAAALPTAAYLDLVGEYLFAYVFDSPDPRDPTLIGSEEVHGEIHQTVLQTLSTAAGGMCRGDCDDIAELYQEVAQRQGKLAHIINIPAHNATAWGERDGETWRVFVLHTGAPLEFKAAKLPDALEAAYGHFGMLESFDPERLDVAIRFSGENTRSRWILGWRIFEERDYAEAMIDVQRDWHYHTYRRAIVKMEKIIADGDDDSANYRELAGLYERTGQWDLAVEFNGKAREGSEDASLSLRMNELRALHEAGRSDDFERLARSIVANELPARERAPSYPMIVLQLVGTISLEKDLTSFALKTLRETIGRGLSYQVANLAFELKEADPRLLQAPQVRQILDLIRTHAFISIGLLDETAKEGEIVDDAHAAAAFLDVETWLRGIAMATVDTDPARLGLYAIAGTFHASYLGEAELDRRLAAASFPEDADHDHRTRAATVLQLKRDLPWIKVSSGYWAGRLNELFDDEHASVDVARVKRLHAAAVAARAAAERIGLAVDPQNRAVHGCAVLEALVTRNEEMLRARLKHAARLGDKQVIDSTMRTIGTTAKRLDGEWFARILEIVGEELDHKPSWFAIAWEAAAVKARENALLAAEAGVAAHPDDTSFEEELRFMRELFGKTD